MNTPKITPATPALHAELQRFARQVQCGFVLTLALSLVMLIVHG